MCKLLEGGVRWEIIYRGVIIGAIKGDTRSLDYGSCYNMFPFSSACETPSKLRACVYVPGSFITQHSSNVSMIELYP